jgi:hypothetical protein
MGDVIPFVRRREDPVSEHLHTLGIPVTRENFIRWNWPGENIEEIWTGECELDLPEELRDYTWTKWPWPEENPRS